MPEMQSVGAMLIGVGTSICLRDMGRMHAEMGCHQGVGDWESTLVSLGWVRLPLIAPMMRPTKDPQNAESKITSAWERVKCQCRNRTVITSAFWTLKTATTNMSPKTQISLIFILDVRGLTRGPGPVDRLRVRGRHGERRLRSMPGMPCPWAVPFVHAPIR
jgi:hypothetical protein